MEPVSFLLTPPTNPLTVRPRAVGGTFAWRSLVEGGALRPVYDDVAVSADQEVDATVRAAALAHLVCGNAVVAGLTAAWVWTDGTPPPLEFVYYEGRGRPRVPKGARVWSSSALTGCVRQIAGVPVTSPERTAVDVALKHPDEAAPVLRNLAGVGVDLAAALLSLERRYRAVGRDRAREAFCAALRTAAA